MRAHSSAFVNSSIAVHLATHATTLQTLPSGNTFVSTAINVPVYGFLYIAQYLLFLEYSNTLSVINHSRIGRVQCIGTQATDFASLIRFNSLSVLQNTCPRAT